MLIIIEEGDVFYCFLYSFEKNKVNSSHKFSEINNQDLYIDLINEALQGNLVFDYINDYPDGHVLEIKPDGTFDINNMCPDLNIDCILTQLSSILNVNIYSIENHTCKYHNKELQSKDILMAEINTIQSILNELDDSRSLEKISLESRLEHLNKELSGNC
jgi:hypothetical protein